MSEDGKCVVDHGALERRLAEAEALIVKLDDELGMTTYYRECRDYWRDQAESLQAKVERLTARGIEDMQATIADLEALLAWYRTHAPKELVAIDGIIGGVVHPQGSRECQRLGLVPCSGCDR